MLYITPTHGWGVKTAFLLNVSVFVSYWGYISYGFHRKVSLSCLGMTFQVPIKSALSAFHYIMFLKWFENIKGNSRNIN